MDLAPGFADPVFDAQRVFRSIMEAMARPGSVQPLAGLPGACGALTPGLAAIALTLADAETPIWLDAALSASSDVAGYLRFHTGAPVVLDPRVAAIALIADPVHCPDLGAFSQGTPEYPDTSVTLVLAVQGFGDGRVLTLEGPGIERQASFAPFPVPPDFGARLRRNRDGFPRGVDHLLASVDGVAGLPRSTRVIG